MASPSGQFDEWLKEHAARLHQESIIHRSLGRLHLGKWRPFDDKVSALKSRPLGMFFYNQRAIFLGFGLLYLIVLGILAWGFRGAHESETIRETILVLAGFWSIAVLVTLSLHRSFVNKVNSWAASRVTYQHSGIFDRYFVIDSLLVLVLIVIGKSRGLNLDGFVSLLLANTIVYSSAYVRRRQGNKRQILVVVFSQITVTGLLFYTDIEVKEPRLFYLVLSLSAFVGMALMTVLSVLMISWLRTIEHETSELRLRLLGLFERKLSETKGLSDADNDEVQFSEKQFRAQATEVLANLCSQSRPFWYRSACLWFFEEHQDWENRVLVPGAQVNFPDASDFMYGLHDPDDLLLTNEVIVLHSLKHHSENSDGPPVRFCASLDAPAAFVPLLSANDERPIGVLALYGEEQGPPVVYEETTFLWSLASIICNTREQWEGRYKILPQKEMDQLFACASLKEMFPQAVKVLKKYLEASGCMLIFRPNPRKPEMEVEAVDGFNRSVIGKGTYLVGVGQTGKCAEIGEPIKWDDVQSHLREFDAERLRILQRALGHELRSWMAIPIGGRNQNYGVIKVVNSLVRSPWFSDYDKQLGTNLAQRLHIMIEKFLHIKEVETANKSAELNAKEAKVEQKKAEESAKQRQEDLMIITHQLQAPLNSIVGAVTLLQRKTRDDRLGMAHDFVEDALALCFGTLTTFGREAGRETAFGVTNIDAPRALRNLARRLQATNSRDDIRFTFKEEPGFPVLKMDWRVFTSVFSSLIHNAMKYADEYSYVTLECSFENGRAALKVKSVGEPILLREKDRIFEKYARGEVIMKTGRHHGGVGLGLWVARELMHAIGGDITVELTPDHPDLSVFVVYVPKVQATNVNELVSSR